VSPSDTIISASGLSQSYGEKVVLHGLRFELLSGAVGLLGPNGSGKTTLLRTLLGLLPIEPGRARVLGLDPAQEALALRRRIGLVPESECLVPGMNAVELTAYAGELTGMQRKDAMQRAHQVLYYVGLGEARYRDLGTYSQGMKQRLKLAQALVHDPDLVLLDEPTNGMDPPGRETMLSLIREISHTKGVSVILSSHLLPDVQETCDSVLILRDGEVKSHEPVRHDPLHEHVLFDLRGRGDFALLGEKLREGGHDFVPIKDGIRVRLREGVEGPEPIFEAALALTEPVEIRHLMPAGRSVEDTFFEAMG
jgi:ABC-2 type transport system ATP-binding protein